ncbi:phosphotransferase family protein [Flaviflexus sp.]|uniref:phosphotransferase family protein n=1 Tax=Flaviflexus sp. TaxID=1969482 RepID=UPI003F926718
MSDWPVMDREQRDLVDEWLPGAEVVADLSWGLVDSTVVRVRHEDRDLIVKAGGPDNHHIAREINGHRDGIAVLAQRGLAPRLLRASPSHRILVTEYLPGELVDEGEMERDPNVLRQAGAVLGVLHGLKSQTDETLERNLFRKAVKWLDKPHRIPPDDCERVREALEAYETSPVTVVPNHGDYSGRNWILHEGRLAVIDFGRYGYRPAHHDFIRMYFRRWHDHPDEMNAFLEGYGSDLRESLGSTWWKHVLREAVATACWAHKVGDEPFEQTGLRFIGIALAELTDMDFSEK